MLEDHRKTITILTDCLRDSAAAAVRAARTLGAVDAEGVSDSDLYAMIPGIDEKFKAIKNAASNVKTLRDTIDIVRMKIEQVEKNSSGQAELPLGGPVPSAPCKNCGTEFSACGDVLTETGNACCDTCVHPAPEPTTGEPGTVIDAEVPPEASPVADGEQPRGVSVEGAFPARACIHCVMAKVDCDEALVATEKLCCEQCSHPEAPALRAVPKEASPS